MLKRSIQKTDDGSYTIYNQDIDECYHSRFGAIVESQHVFIKNGLECIRQDEVMIFEVGFGTGLNALLTYIYAKNNQKKINYITVEKYPIGDELVAGLDYSNHLGSDDVFFKQLHQSSWNQSVEINPFFNLLKIKDDLKDIDLSSFKSVDLIYFDAFSPTKQPELWNADLFRKLIQTLKPGGILVTYSASGLVKNALRQAGFDVKRLQGPPGKHHMLLAKNNS